MKNCQEIWGVRARFCELEALLPSYAAHHFVDRTPRPGASAIPERVQSHRFSRGAVSLLMAQLGFTGELEADSEWGFVSFLTTKGQRLSVSLAHTEDVVCVVLSTSPIGVDVENSSRSVEKLIPRLFTAREREWVTKEKIPPIDLWCAKEALLKALGTGIQGGLTKVELRSEGPGLYVASSEVKAPLLLEQPAVKVAAWRGFQIAVAGERRLVEGGVRWLDLPVGSQEAARGPGR